MFKVHKYIREGIWSMYMYSVYVYAYIHMCVPVCILVIVMYYFGGVNILSV